MGVSELCSLACQAVVGLRERQGLDVTYLEYLLRIAILHGLNHRPPYFAHRTYLIWQLRNSGYSESTML
jgi:hypothetical protein